MKALLLNNKIVQVAEETFEVHESLNWVDCPENCSTTWTYENNEFIAPAEPTNEELQLRLKNDCENAITALIQSKVDDYNTENNLLFNDVHSCANYALSDGYTHQAFCIAIWAWNISVWETARSILSQALNGEIEITQVSDVIALLPEFTFGQE